MTWISRRASTRLRVLLGLIVVLLAAPAGAAAETEVKLVRRFGPKVNLTKVQEREKGAHVEPEEEDICVESEETCQPGTNFEGEEPNTKLNSGTSGQFALPEGVALHQTPSDAVVYVADRGHNRIDVYDGNGAFLFAFGSEVNLAKEDICDKGETCLPGQEGEAAGEFGGRFSGIAVDQSTGDVYVADKHNHRVMVFDGQGHFLLTFGEGVNKTAVEAKAGTSAEDVCTAASKNICQAGATGNMSGEFRGWPLEEPAALLAVGGPEGHVYVGDSETVREFTRTGVPVGSVDVAALGSGYTVFSLAVDTAGDLYVTAANPFGFPSTQVHKYSPAGVEEAVQFGAGATTARSSTPALHGQVITIESDPSCAETCQIPHHGAVYNENGALLTTFTEGFVWGNPDGSAGVVYDPEFEQIYTAETESSTNSKLGAQVLVFKGPVTFATVRGTSEDEVSAGRWRFTAKVFAEEFNVSSIEFRYGSCGKAERAGMSDAEIEVACAGQDYQHTVTAKVAGASAEPIAAGEEIEIEAQLSGLEANSVYHAVAVAANVNGQSQSKQPAFFATPLLPAEAKTAPTEEVRPQAARLTGTVDPLNDMTSYRYEYGPCVPLAACGEAIYLTELVQVGEGDTPVDVSRVVGGLTPGTTYSYRLVAVNQHGDRTTSESTMTTSAAVPPTVLTGPATEVGLSQATLAANVDPNGAAAIWRLEIGVDEGAATIFHPDRSGNAGDGTAPVPVSAALTDLQAGTTYLYRFTAASAEGETTSSAADFTTQGLPAISLPPLAMELLEASSVKLVGTGTNNKNKGGKGNRHKRSKKKKTMARKQSKHRH
jgi:NHL repeat